MVTIAAVGQRPVLSALRRGCSVVQAHRRNPLRIPHRAIPSRVSH